MKRSVFWQAMGFGITTLVGTLLHFLYDWTGGSALAAVFSGVNESTWEHIKLLYWPLFLFGIFQSFFFRQERSYWWVKLTATVFGLALIPALFYTYNGMFGKSPDLVNIAIFYISAGGSFLFERWAFRKGLMQWKYPQLGLGVLALIGALFVVFTFCPPRLPLFQDPVTGGFGI